MNSCVLRADWMPGMTEEHLLSLPAAGAVVSGRPHALQGSGMVQLLGGRWSS